jgi:hypothetical protein
MKIKTSEATQEEKNNLFVFLLESYKKDCENSPFLSDIEIDEIDEYLEIKKQSISIQKFEIELDNVIKVVFNNISFFQSEIPEGEFVVENGEKVIKSTGKISKSIMYHSCFYEFVDNKFVDITEDDLIHFSYC